MSEAIDKQVFELALVELLELLDLSPEQFARWETMVPGLAALQSKGADARYGLKELYWCYQLKRLSRQAAFAEGQFDLSKLAPAIDDLQLSSTFLGLRKRLFETRLNMRRSLKKLLALPSLSTALTTAQQGLYRADEIGKKLWVVSFLSIAEAKSLLEATSPIAGHSVLRWASFIVKQLELQKFEDFRWLLVDFETIIYDQVQAELAKCFLDKAIKFDFLPMLSLRRAGSLWRKAAAAQANLYFLPLENPLIQGEVCRLGLESGESVAAYGLNEQKDCNWNGELFISSKSNFSKQGYQTMVEEVPHLVDNKSAVTQKLANECLANARAVKYYKNSLEWGPAGRHCRLDHQTYSKAIEMRSRSWLSRTLSTRTFEVTPRIALTCEQFQQRIGGSIEFSRRLFDDQDS